MSIEHVTTARYCTNCGRPKNKAPVCYTNDPYCSENCRKVLDGEMPADSVPMHPSVIQRGLADGSIVEFEALDVSEGFGG